MKVFQSPLFWVGAVILIALGIGVVVKSFRRNEPGFRDFVKNPELWDDLVQKEQEIGDGVEAARSWNEQQVAAAVRRFVFSGKSSREASADARLLGALGAKTHPILLDFLNDPSLRSKLIKPTVDDILPEAPFNRVCNLLDESPPAAAVHLIAPFLDEPSKEIRKSAAFVLGSAGTEAIIGPVRKALQDSDEYVRSYALMGIERAIKGKRLDPACTRQLFGDLEKLLAEGKNADNAAGLLLHFDQQHATELFLSAAMFKPEAAALHEMLRALNAKSLLVPRDRLLGLIRKLSTRELKYPQSYQLAEALGSLGRHRRAEDRVTIEKHLSHREEIVAQGAAAGMLALHALGGFEERIWKMIEERGVAALSAPQLRQYAVITFHGEVNNGGLSQYFFNSSGDEWRAAMAGLEAMESKERRVILGEAIAKFGPAGPSENREERMKQLSKLARADDDVFDELDSRYYQSNEVIEVLATRYVLRNPEAFR